MHCVVSTSLEIGAEHYFSVFAHLEPVQYILFYNVSNLLSPHAMCRSSSSDSASNPWGDSSDVEDGAELENEWRARREEHYNRGYLEGLEEGKQQSVQAGFDQGEEEDYCGEASESLNGSRVREVGHHAVPVTWHSVHGSTGFQEGLDLGREWGQRAGSLLSRAVASRPATPAALEALNARLSFPALAPLVMEGRAEDLAGLVDEALRVARDSEGSDGLDAPNALQD